MTTHPAFPELPERLGRLGELAMDLWWSWNYQARAVFRTLDYTLWRATAHNPVLMLHQIGGKRLDRKAASGFTVLDLDLLEKVLKRNDIAKLWAATGWFLERFQKTFHVPDAILTRMERRRPRSKQYLERGRRGGILAKRWNLILPKEAFDLEEPGELLMEIR